MSKRKVFSKKGKKPHVLTGEDIFKPEEDDLLLDLYFQNLAWNTICNRLPKHTLRGLKRRLFRLATGARLCYKYIPMQRIERTGTPFTRRDMTVIRKCLFSRDKDCKLETRKEKFAYLRKIIRRRIKEIKNYVNPDRGKGFGLLNVKKTTNH